MCLQWDLIVDHPEQLTVRCGDGLSAVGVEDGQRQLLLASIAHVRRMWEAPACRREIALASQGALRCRCPLRPIGRHENVVRQLLTRPDKTGELVDLRALSPRNKGMATQVR